jgi:hypothetical protein
MKFCAEVSEGERGSYWVEENASSRVIDMFYKFVIPSKRCIFVKNI